jgi:hypothetical protein
MTATHRSEKSPPKSSSIASRDDDGLLFTTDRSNMDYVTLSGVCKRTGAEEPELPVFLLQQLTDNALDSIESCASPATSVPGSHGVSATTDDNVVCREYNEPQIYVDIKFDDEKRYLAIIVKNSNFGSEETGFTEQRIHSIFGNLDVFHSSKRNQFRVSRGIQGDALKVVLCTPFALAAKYQSYFNKPWNEPLILRNGFGKEFEIRAVVDKIARRTHAHIQTREIPSNKDGSTEVEVHIPYDPKLSKIVNPDVLLSVIFEYALLNPGFHFGVVNADAGSSSILNESLAATQRMSTHSSSKRISVYSHDLDSFENLIYIIADDNLILYDFLRNNFREGSNLKKDDDLLITIGQLKREGPSKIHDIYRRLCNAMPPPGLYAKSKRDLVPFDIKDREEALAARIKQLGYNIINIKYKAAFGYYNSSSEDNKNVNVNVTAKGSLLTTHTEFPFLVEVTIAHTSSSFNLLYCEGINGSPRHYYSFLQGDELTWTSKSGKQNVAHHVMDLLEKYGYSRHTEKCKKPGSIVIVNLWSPKIEYTDYGKSQINLKPFSKAIAETLYKMCSGGSGGKGLTDDNNGSDKQRAIEIFTDFLKKRQIQVLNNPELKNTDRWNTSTPVYRIRPILEKNGLGHLSRKYLQGLVRTICNRLSVKREDLGIYEATRAQLYFRGGIYDVSLEQLGEIEKKGADILIIEKEGVVELLIPHADKYGFALCYTKGFLTDNAKKFCELASSGGGNVAILTDLDMSGLLIAGKVPGIHRIGMTLDTLQALGIPTSEVAEDLSEGVNNHTDAVKKLYLDGIIAEKDWNFLNGGKYGKRIEIDNVLAYVGAERFWQDLVVKEFGEHFPSRDYSRSIDVPEHITPPELQYTIDFVHGQTKDLIKAEREKCMLNLKNYEGFMPDAAREENAMQHRMQEKLKESKRLSSYLEELEALRKKYDSNP